ncbi:GAF domain-containing protein [Deinococcus ruber]|uniref:histidine kinase n=1 Tax=Deinococcus ruber TaxID=1848197 RepID=A0A918F5K2_9DEIO|nr:GAF domain-containing protein [Deinococcus ruber]GGR10952.1 hypothetical protein GCM10008957_24640 [Deinococcus ruber]
MFEPSALGIPAHLSLSEHLQHVTQTLAATTVQEDVLRTVLTAAVSALKATAGVVLLLDAAGDTLVVAGAQSAQEPGIWQDSSVDSGVPAGDALAQRQPLFFEHPGALAAAYPDLEAASGAAAPAACAVLPMVLDGQPLGSILLDFDHAHEFTAAEQRFLQIVAAQCSVALGRSTVLTQLQQQILANGALNAFTRFTQAAADTTEFTVLVSQAVEVLRATIGDVSVAYYELHQGTWQARALSDDLSPEHLKLISAGFPENTPRFANAVRAGQLQFVSGWRPVEAGFPEEPRYGALASYPYLPESSFPRLLSVGAKNKVSWSDQEQAIVRAVGRTLGLALERALQTQELQEERAGLDAFVAFAEAAGTKTDTLALIRQASTVLRATLEQVSVAYYELEDGLWKARVWTDDVPADVVRDIQAGIPQDAPNFLEAAQSDSAVFVDGWKAEENHVSSATVYGAVALVHIGTGERPRLFTLGTVHARAWTARERASVRAVGRSLTLALERADLSAQLERRTRQIEESARAQEAFVAFTEAVGSETDVLTLARQAIQVMQAQLPEVGVAYYQLEDQVWKGAVWSDDVPPEVADQLRLGVPADSPNFSHAVRTGAALFANRWDAHADQLAQATMYGAAAFVPLIVDGQAHAMFAVGKRTGTLWTVREQGIIRALGRSLGLALERTEYARQLEVQKAVVDSRNQALEAFAQLTRDIANETDRYALIQRTQELVLSLLSPGYALYWERAGDRWQLKSQVGDIGHPALQRLVDEEGLPFEAPTLHFTWTTGRPLYQDQYAQGADTPADLIRHVHAAASLRLNVHGVPVGMLAIGLFDQRRWNSADRAVLETTISSLGLALERAQGLAELAKRTTELEQSNQDLSAANEELEAFTYSASHDLRTPVRHVMGFAELALKALQKGQYDKVAQHLEVVKQAAGRMTSLIDGMLVLSRSGRQELNVQWTDLNALVTQAQRDVAAEFSNQPVQWHIEPLPRIQGDPLLLQQVLTNLLSNAVKYSAKRDVSDIRVWAEERPAEWAIHVQDNGVGFDARYARKLFGIFQRLHHERDFRGTGVGLATVRRIVLKHGGRVSAESHVNSGATFSFTLPKSG